MKKWAIVGCVSAAAVGGFLINGLVDRVPREAMTANAMILIERAIRQHYAETGTLPERIDDGNLLWQGRPVRCVNSYGHPILYSVSNGSVVELKSYGFCGEDAEVKQIFLFQFDVRDEETAK